MRIIIMLLYLLHVCKTMVDHLCLSNEERAKRKEPLLRQVRRNFRGFLY